MKTLLGSCLLFFSLICFGEQWDSVVINDSNSVYFYDPNTVQRKGDLVQYWELSNYKVGLTYGKVLVLSSKSLVEVDCGKHRYRTLRVIDYEKDSGLGRVLNVGLTENSDWISNVIGTVSSSMEEKVCLIGTKK